LTQSAEASAPAWRWRGGSGHDKALFAIAVAFASFQIYTAAFSPLSSIVLRSIHVGFLLLLAFAIHDWRGRGGGRSTALDWTLGGLGFLLGLYHWVFEAELVQRAGDPSTLDLVVAGATVLLVFEAARRLMGLALPSLCAAFLAYALLGNWLPGPLRIRPYGLDQVLDQMALGTEGIYGTPIFVSATYIFLFILFGTFLERSGMIQLFNDVAMGTVGHTRGGPAKVAVISSALMGTINGSGVANVVTVGQFTIPLMKRFGYDPAFAGAVEATASMGGQIMPPVMGAVAFIMAETLGVPYLADRQGGDHPGAALFRRRPLDGASRGRPGPAGGTAARPDAERLGGADPPLVPAAAAGGAGLPAVRRLHAALRRHRRPRAHRRADPRRAALGADRRPAAAHRLLAAARHRRRRLLPLRHRRGLRADRRAGRRRRGAAGRSGDVAAWRWRALAEGAGNALGGRRRLRAGRRA
jgi:hypothetical protein